MAFLSRSFLSRWALATLFALSIASYSHSQQEAPNKRRLVGHSAPAYPSLARSMALQGVVRVEAGEEVAGRAHGAAGHPGLENIDPAGVKPESLAPAFRRAAETLLS